MLIQTVLSAVLAMSVSGVGPRESALIGRISDGTTPISGAIVTISKRAFVKSTTTDENGRFVLEALPSGRYGFRTSAQGYAVFECPVVIHDGDSNRNRISVTALVPADQQTVSVTELKRRQSPTIVHNPDPGQIGNDQQSLR